MTAYRHVEPLTAQHEIADFDCGSEAQTAWLLNFALQAQLADSARVYVICRSGTVEVAGYYALSAGSVSHDQVPPRLTKGVGRYPIPIVVLTRLGVDLRDQHQGLGSELVYDALLQSALVADRIAVRAMAIHAETAEAVAFYQGISPVFATSPTDPLHLVLLTKDLRLMLGEAAKQQTSDG